MGKPSNFVCFRLKQSEKYVARILEERRRKKR
jgi:hypothetical protein